jgi:hypothetical protein
MRLSLLFLALYPVSALLFEEGSFDEYASGSTEDEVLRLECEREEYAGYVLDGLTLDEAVVGGTAVGDGRKRADANLINLVAGTTAGGASYLAVPNWNAPMPLSNVEGATFLKANGGSSIEHALLTGSPKGVGASGKAVRCNKGVEASDFPPAVSGEVCIITRGDTSFRAKVEGCEAAGGVAAVIVNKEDGVFGGTLSGYEAKIPVVGVGAEFDAQFSGGLEVSMYLGAIGDDVRNLWPLGPPRDQGSCGSCYLYSATSVIEMHMNMIAREAQIRDAIDALTPSSTRLITASADEWLAGGQQLVVNVRDVEACVQESFPFDNEWDLRSMLQLDFAEKADAPELPNGRGNRDQREEYRALVASVAAAASDQHAKNALTRLAAAGIADVRRDRCKPQTTGATFCVDVVYGGDEDIVLDLVAATAAPKAYLSLFQGTASKVIGAHLSLGNGVCYGGQGTEVAGLYYAAQQAARGAGNADDRQIAFELPHQWSSSNREQREEADQSGHVQAELTSSSTTCPTKTSDGSSVPALLHRFDALDGSSVDADERDDDFDATAITLRGPFRPVFGATRAPAGSAALVAKVASYLHMLKRGPIAVSMPVCSETYSRWWHSHPAYRTANAYHDAECTKASLTHAVTFVGAHIEDLDEALVDPAFKRDGKFWYERSYFIMQNSHTVRWGNQGQAYYRVDFALHYGTAWYPLVRPRDSLINPYLPDDIFSKYKLPDASKWYDERHKVAAPSPRLGMSVFPLTPRHVDADDADAVFDQEGSLLQAGVRLGNVAFSYVELVFVVLPPEGKTSFDSECTVNVSDVAFAAVMSSSFSSDAEYSGTAASRARTCAAPRLADDGTSLIVGERSSAGVFWQLHRPAGFTFVDNMPLSTGAGSTIKAKRLVVRVPLDCDSAAPLSKEPASTWSTIKVALGRSDGGLVNTALDWWNDCDELDPSIYLYSVTFAVDATESAVFRSGGTEALVADDEAGMSTAVIVAIVGGILACLCAAAVIVAAVFTIAASKKKRARHV